MRQLNSTHLVKQAMISLLAQQIMNPLLERRDYVPQGHDILEQQALALEQKDMLPKTLEKDMKDRLKLFPAQKNKS